MAIRAWKKQCLEFKLIELKHCLCWLVYSLESLNINQHFSFEEFQRVDIATTTKLIPAGLSLSQMVLILLMQQRLQRKEVWFLEMFLNLMKHSTLLSVLKRKFAHPFLEMFLKLMKHSTLLSVCYNLIRPYLLILK